MTPTATLVTRYIAGRRARREITADTMRQQQRILSAFATVVGRRPVERIGRRDVERWLESRSTLAPGTRRLEFGVVRSFCRWLVQEGRTRRDATAGMRAPKVPRSIPRALSRDECDRIAAVLPDARAKVIFSLMRRCGLRRAEVARLEVADWDRVGRSLRVVGKGGHVRLVAVPSDVDAALDAYVLHRGGALVRNERNGRAITPAHIHRLVTGWMRDAGVKVRPWDGRASHSLRHTIASEVYETTHDLELVGGILGHARLTSTQVYIRRSTLVDQLAALDEAA